MKLVFSILLGFAVLAGLSTAQARPGDTCTVTFKKCDVVIAGFCAKWNNKTETISRWEARTICYDLERRYGQVKNCQVTNCDPGDRPRHREFWQMETRNGQVLREYGSDQNAKYDCERDLRFKQCRRGENPFATCVGYYQGRVFDRIGPFCDGRRPGPGPRRPFPPRF